MENFIASALKYRPTDFSEVVGQEAITQTLDNAIRSGKIPRALLFCGPRGVGKTTCARILARKINEDALGPSADNDFAFNIFELDAASNNSVDDIRALIDQVRIPPQVGPYKVYIIDEVHMLSSQAFNAFLKTLEEPPRHAVFILATTEKHKILPTILSRCQIYDFKRIGVKDTVEHLKVIAEDRKVEAEEGALFLIARKADGAMRDALSIFDRIASYADGRITVQKASEVLQVLDLDTFLDFSLRIGEGDIPGLIRRFNDISMLGFDGQHFIIGLADHLRDLLVAGSTHTIDLLEVSEEQKKQLAERSRLLSKEQLVRAIDLATDCDYRYKESSNQRLLVEITLMKLASLTGSTEKKKADLILPADAFRTSGTVSPSAASQTQVTSPKEAKPSQAATATSSPVEPNAQKSADTSAPQSTGMPPEQPERAPSGPVSSQSKGESRKKAPVNEETGTPQAQAEIPSPQLASTPVRISALSLSSIRKKKESSGSSMGENRVETSLNRQEAFALEDACAYWKAFADKLEAEGRQIVASNLNMAPPYALEGTLLRVALPNDTMKKELEEESPALLAYLRNQLRNDAIRIEVETRENEERQYLYTPEEKYQRMKELNPSIDLLRRELDLDF